METKTGKIRKVYILLFFIIFFGAFLRLYKLDKFPPSLFGDEVDVGYQAYSILKTGKDYMGQPWPISFHSLADWRTPLFLYSAVPTVAIFGLNEWGVRLPPALFGILTLPIFFLLTRRLFKNENLALLGTFFLSVSMWHLQYSRAAFEVTQMLFLLIAGLYFFFKGMEKWFYLLPSAIFLALTPYSYNTAKFFLPLFLLLLVFCFRNNLKKIPFKKLILVAGIFVLISLPMGFDILWGKASDRFSILSIFTDPTVVPQIGFDRLVDANLSLGDVRLGLSPSLPSRIFHNKFLYWGLSLLKNYFKAFSTEFLFIFGDINFRHSIQAGFGQFYWLEIVFLLTGLHFLKNYKDKDLKKFVFFWLLLSPIPSCLTRDGGNHATRLILMLPPLLIINSFGTYCLVNSLKNRKMRYVLGFFMAFVFIVQFSLYLHRYYVHYPKESEEWWHCGFKELARYVKENEEKFGYIVFSDRDQPPLIFSLFWLGVDPRIFQQNKLEWVKINEALSADHLPKTKYYFGHVSEERIKNYWPQGTLNKQVLYLAPGGETGVDYRYHALPGSLKLLETVYYPSGRVAKYILTGN